MNSFSTFEKVCWGVLAALGGTPFLLMWAIIVRDLWRFLT